MLHQHGHHHVDEHELGGEHEGDKVHGRDKLKAWIAGIVHIGVMVWWALPQCVLKAEEYQLMKNDCVQMDSQSDKTDQPSRAPDFLDKIL